MKQFRKRKSIIEFVKLANHFLFFIGFFAIASIVAFKFYEDYSRSNQRYGSSLQVVDEKEIGEMPIEYKKSFVKKYDDIFIFKVRSNRLVSRNNTGTELEGVRGFAGGYDANEFESVNFLFVRQGSKPKLLLPVHALILDFKLARLQSDYDRYMPLFKTTKHVFEVVSNDTNLDKVMNKDDQIDLVASDIDGTNLITIAHNIQAFEVIDENQLMITREIETGTEISIYDLVTGENKVLEVDISKL